MWQYFIRRLLLVVPTFIGITIVVFTITRFVPGGPIERMIMETQMASHSGRSSMGSSSLSEAQLQQLKEYYGFDKPILTSYFLWLSKVVRFDLGQSTRYNEPVKDSILARLPVSAFFGFTTFSLTYLICIPLGIFKAIYHKSVFDNFSSLIIFIGYALPGYVVGIGLMVLLAANLEILPLGGFVSENFSDLNFFDKVVDLARHTFLPLTSYMVGSIAVMTFLTKNTLLDHLSADYVRTAMAKGRSFRGAVLSHALQNSLIPLATHFGNNLSALLAGSFLIEKIYNINGFGLLGYESVVERDYPVVMGVLVVSALLQLVGNIISDLCVAFLDPRVQFH